MPVYVWPALGISIALVLGSAFYAAASGLRAWRSFKRFRRKVSEGFADVTNRAAKIDRHLNRAGDSAAQFERANAHLRTSLADARLLADAFGEFRTLISRVTGFVP